MKTSEANHDRSSCKQDAQPKYASNLLSGRQQDISRWSYGNAGSAAFGITSSLLFMLLSVCGTERFNSLLGVRSLSQSSQVQI